MTIRISIDTLMGDVELLSVAIKKIPQFFRGKILLRVRIRHVFGQLCHGLSLCVLNIDDEMNLTIETFIVKYK
jgi:hypothetical protein